MALELVPTDCYSWIIVAFFVGFSGKRGVKHFHEVLLASRDATDDVEDDGAVQVNDDDDESGSGSP